MLKHPPFFLRLGRPVPVLVPYHVLVILWVSPHFVILRKFSIHVILRNGVTNGSVYIHVYVFRSFASLRMTRGREGMTRGREGMRGGMIKRQIVSFPNVLCFHLLGRICSARTSVILAGASVVFTSDDSAGGHLKDETATVYASFSYRNQKPYGFTVFVLVCGYWNYLWSRNV